MSMHRIPLTELERVGLTNHGLPIGNPSQLSDVFRHGVKWALDNVKAVSQWIPVSEQMPENEGTYFCLGHNGTPFVCLFRTTKYEGKIWLRSTGTKRIYGITHWMPLPAAPVKDLKTTCACLTV